MAVNDYVPMSFNGESITTEKLNQVCNNIEYIFERAPKIRYSSSGIVRDSGLKVISGKTPFGASQLDWINVEIYFGSFFTVGCHPSVNATVEITKSVNAWRKYVSIGGLGADEIDHTGFLAQVVSHESGYRAILEGGWIHWTAVGY